MREILILSTAIVICLAFTSLFMVIGVRIVVYFIPEKKAKRKFEYKILLEPSHVSMTISVDEYISRGWEPAGGISVQRININEDHKFIQAMKRRK